MVKRKWTKEEIAEYRKLKGSFFYINKEDSNLFVPKEYGIGWTLNFGNQISWMIILVIVALFVGSQFF